MIQSDSVLHIGVGRGNGPVLERPANWFHRGTPGLRPGLPSNFRRKGALPILEDARSRNDRVFAKVQHEHVTIGELNSNRTPAERDDERLGNLPDPPLGRGGGCRRWKWLWCPTDRTERRTIGTLGVTGGAKRGHGNVRLRAIKKDSARSSGGPCCSDIELRGTPEPAQLGRLEQTPIRVRSGWPRSAPRGDTTRSPPWAGRPSCLRLGGNGASDSTPCTPSTARYAVRTISPPSGDRCAKVQSKEHQFGTAAKARRLAATM